jgi:hypothetical protein
MAEFLRLKTSWLNVDKVIRVENIGTGDQDCLSSAFCRRREHPRPRRRCGHALSFPAGQSGKGEMTSKMKTMKTVSISELHTIRVTCKKCRSQTTIEGPLRRIDRAFEENQCPICKEPFRKSKDKEVNHFDGLQRAIEGFVELRDLVEIEFVIPVEQEPANRP